MFQEHLREVIHSIRQAHPDWSATEVYIAVYAEMHGDDGRKAAVAIVKSDPRVPERFCRAHPS
jgi:hypothetical protein